ncbi:MAG: hypothetical protein WCF65_00970 [Parachlamydiaceae bacterium]
MEEPQHGDHYFLFTHLPIAGELYSHLPIPLSSGIYLASTPYHAVAQGAPVGSLPERHVGLGAWVYLGHGLGMGQCHACLKVDPSHSVEMARRYCWAMVGALHLAKPIRVVISGSFTYGTLEDGLLGRETNHINHRTNVCLDSFFSHDVNGEPLRQYAKEDLVLAGKLFPLILNCLEQRQHMPRLYSVLQLFFEAVIWERLHYASSSFSKLFPMLDAFVGNPSRHHANRVATRLSKFLANTPSAITGKSFTAQEIEARLKAIWDDHRPPGLHGYIKDLSFPGSSISPKITPEIKDLFDLLEIARIAVIKMLLLEPSVVQAYNQISIPHKAYEDAEKRNAESTEFFRHSYISPKEMVLYTDLR